MAKTTKTKPVKYPTEKVADPQSLEARRARAVDIARKQVEASMEFKQPRMKEISENESIYLGKKRPALKNRFNVPFDTIVMQGDIDTVLSKSDDRPSLDFDSEVEEAKRCAMKLSSAFDRESSDDKGRWSAKDRLAKKMAYLAGRALFEKYSYYDKKKGYVDVLKVEDHYNFQCEPGGGPYLEDHLGVGTINNFFGKDQLMKGTESELYDKAEVQKLINSDDAAVQKKTKDDYQNIENRYRAMGLDLAQHNYVGQQMFNLVKWEMEFEGERVYMLFDMRTGACVRFCALTEVSPSNRYTWTSWATHEEFVFWSRAYADTIKPVGEVYRVLVNQMLENINKRNWNMRAYDPSVFTDSAKLLYSPDGLVKANLKPGMTSVAQGIFELQTPETTSVTLNAMEWLDSFFGQKSGITPGDQGNTQDQKVGIYYGNQQQTAERFSLLNKQYVQCYIDLGILFDWGIYECMPQDYMVKVIGIDGIGWEKLTKEDLEPDFSVRITSTNASAAENQLKASKKTDAITQILGSQLLIGKVSGSWLVEEILRNGGYTDESVRVALDTQTDGTREVLLRAAESIRKIVDGEWPVKLVYNATTGFLQKIVDYANEHADEMSMDIFHKLNIYATAHQQIVIENMTRKAMLVASMQGTPSTALSLPPGAGNTPIPGQGQTTSPVAPAAQNSVIPA